MFRVRSNGHVRCENPTLLRNIRAISIVLSQPSGIVKRAS